MRKVNFTVIHDEIKLSCELDSIGTALALKDYHAAGRFFDNTTIVLVSVWTGADCWVYSWAWIKEPEEVHRRHYTGITRSGYDFSHCHD